MTKDLILNKDYVDHARRVEYLEISILGGLERPSNRPVNLEELEALKNVLSDLMDEYIRVAWPPFEE